MGYISFESFGLVPLTPMGPKLSLGSTVAPLPEAEDSVANGLPEPAPTCSNDPLVQTFICAMVET
jgi:hypothetical protein